MSVSPLGTEADLEGDDASLEKEAVEMEEMKSSDENSTNEGAAQKEAKKPPVKTKAALKKEPEDAIELEDNDSLDVSLSSADHNVGGSSKAKENTSKNEDTKDDLIVEDTMHDYDTRSEVSSTSSKMSKSSVVSKGSHRSSKSSISSDGEDDARGHKRKRPVSDDNEGLKKAGSPKRMKSGRKISEYDYATKLNYLFRDCRFFLIKSHNAENVEISKSKGIWSTPHANESKLNQAYREHRNVILIFSVKESGQFCGCARMASESRKDMSPVSWVLPPGLSSSALGGLFQLDWISKHGLPFQKTLHLYNPWNEGKPVKIGRDGQEIETRVAEELCRLFGEDDTAEWSNLLRRSKEAAKRLGDKARPHRLGPMFGPVPGPRRRDSSNSGGNSHVRGRGGFRSVGSGPAGSSGSGYSGSHGGDSGRGSRRRYDDDFRSRGMKRGRGHPYRDFKESRREVRDRSPPTRYSGPRERSYPQSYPDYYPSYRASTALAPIPYPPPPPFEGLPPPRYYDGLPLPEYPPPPLPRTSRTESKRYERSVDEFLRRTADRHDRSRERRVYRDRR